MRRGGLGDIHGLICRAVTGGIDFGRPLNGNTGAGCFIASRRYVSVPFVCPNGLHWVYGNNDWARVGGQVEDRASAHCSTSITSRLAKASALARHGTRPTLPGLLNGDV